MFWDLVDVFLQLVDILSVSTHNTHVMLSNASSSSQKVDISLKLLHTEDDDLLDISQMQSHLAEWYFLLQQQQSGRNSFKSWRSRAVSEWSSSCGLFLFPVPAIYTQFTGTADATHVSFVYIGTKFKARTKTFDGSEHTSNLVYFFHQ